MNAHRKWKCCGKSSNLPSNETIDLCTQYSGITPDHLKHCDNALGIVRSQVVDTALVFPGRIYKEWYKYEQWKQGLKRSSEKKGYR